jgi:hypothetical protein
MQAPDSLFDRFAMHSPAPQDPLDSKKNIYDYLTLRRREAPFYSRAIPTLGSLCPERGPPLPPRLISNQIDMPNTQLRPN